MIFSVSAFSQKIDTVKFYYNKYSTSEIEQVRKYNYKFVVYKLGYFQKKFNGRDTVYEIVYDEVSKEEYDNYQKSRTDFEKCRPCWQKHYDFKGILIWEGFYSTDCIIGELREYKDGKLIRISFWRRLSEEESKDHSKSLCHVRTGEWIYFDNSGKKVKVERYKDDVLIESINF